MFKSVCCKNGGRLGMNDDQKDGQEWKNNTVAEEEKNGICGLPQ